MARSRRRSRLRTTEPPTAFETTKPNRAGPGAGWRYSTACPALTRRPRRIVMRKSSARTTRFGLASTVVASTRSVVALRGQFGATLGTTSGQDAATGAGAHAQAEAVNLRALAVVRLERSLAHSCISKNQLLEPERCGMPEGGSQLVKNTGLKLPGQTTASQPTILHMLITGVGKDTRVRTKVKRVAQFRENARHQTLPASYSQWITL
jgi:hypothetical protein